MAWRRQAPGPATLALLVSAAACGNTLVDHNAPPTLLGVTECEAGFQTCGGGCFAPSTLICDPESCEVCAVPNDAVGECTAAAACSFTCVNGTHRCEQVPGLPLCVAESATSCGNACEVCAGPTAGPGQGVCLPGPSPGTGHCGVDCEIGHELCGTSCVAESAESCGESCEDCRPSTPAQATAECTSAHTCAFVCNPGLLRCGDGCCAVSALALGAEHACAVTTAGGLLCWGANGLGQLGDGTTSDRDTPTEIYPSGSEVTGVATGFAHTCAVVGGAVHCWGSNATLQLGPNATGSESPAPVAVGLSSVVTIAAGGYLNSGGAPTAEGHTCAVTTNGEVRCWGAGNAGQLGFGDTTSSATPRPVAGVTASTVTSGGVLAAGARHTCVVTAAGGLACWGDRTSGQVGDGAVSPTPAVSPATVLTTASFVAAGVAHGCAIDTSQGDPVVLCWGSNAEGEIGAGATTPVPAPTAPEIGGGIASLRPTRLAAGRAHSCMLRLGDIGGLKCMGANDVGQRGTPASIDPGGVSAAPIPVADLAVDVAAGGDSTCARLTSGAVYCWGDNRRGQLGDGSTTSRPDPLPVSGR
ncbi:MAG: hypothetical protein HY903_03940 [Deltaproteobacteria bacterium]|nr:hypothetical protein [Deltaproteobacteria bacterium]